MLDRLMSEQADRTQLVREKGWEAAHYEKRSRLLMATREHYVVLLEQIELLGQAPAGRLERPAAAEPGGELGTQTGWRIHLAPHSRSPSGGCSDGA